MPQTTSHVSVELGPACSKCKRLADNVAVWEENGNYVLEASGLPIATRIHFTAGQLRDFHRGLGELLATPVSLTDHV